MPKRYKKSPSFSAKLFNALIVLELLVLLVSYLQPWLWFSEALALFRFHIGLLLLLTSALALLASRQKWTIFSFLLSLIAIYPNASLWLPDNKSDIDTMNSSLLSMELSGISGQPEQVLELIYKDFPDMLYLQGLQKADEAWLEELKLDYPYFKVLNREGGYGVAFFSRQKWVSMQVVEFELSGYPSFSIRMENDNREMELLLTHLLPPFSKSSWELRRKQVDAMLDWVSEIPEGREVLLVGPLYAEGTTITAKELEETGLNNAYAGSGWMPNWPEGSRLSKLTVTQLYQSEGIKVRDIQQLPSLGGAQRPVMIRW